MDLQSHQHHCEQKDLGKQQVPDPENPRGAISVRRNPPRRAKHTPATQDRKPSRYPQSAVGGQVAPFSMDDCIDAESSAHPRTLSKPSEAGAESSENLRVFLRIRPLEVKPIPDGKPYKDTGKPRTKGAPSNGVGKSRSREENTACCLVVNDSSSVSLAAPPSSLDSKRGKSEVFDGFSFVFPPESRQKDVYERVLEPLVVDFLHGKSGLLAAMGPTGSGKTHTMFGCPREPGIVHLALKRIFCHEDAMVDPHKLRSYYLSMFEIYSDRGKGERIFDLSGEADLSLQQSTIRGLQEVMVSNITEAECVIERGMLKRVTAVTNANCQSSRSQCVINIRSEPKFAHDEGRMPNGSVLTILDLAGAERERKTGNQGARLLESNFINNTSMVFSLCLRSLLEHQKNPKRPLQKHFQNSLLTRYLRDYMEGKKRMTLILTVKPGEDDYNDSSFLLRQASPYMRIKFNSVEEPHNAPCRKRYNLPLAKLEHPKRMKCAGRSLIFPVDGTKSGEVGCPASEKESTPSQVSSGTLEPSNSMPEMALLDELKRIKRNNQVLQNFSKALWNVLKQYKRKLEVSENDAENLRRKLREEEARFLELAKQLEDLKSHNYSCCRHFFHPVTSNSKQEIKSELCAVAVPSTQEAGDEAENFASTDVNDLSEAPEKQIRKAKEMANSSSNKILSNVDLPGTGDALSDHIVSSSLSHVLMKNNASNVTSPVDMALSMEGEKASGWKTTSTYGSQSSSDCHDLKGGKSTAIMGMSTMATFAENNFDPLVIPAQSLNTASVDISVCHSTEKRTALPLEMPFSEASASLIEDVEVSGDCEATILPNKENCISPKMSNLQKPRRRLLPASVMLLKELNGFDMEIENAKESRCSEGLEVTVQRGRTQGSSKLFHLLRSNLQ